MTGKVLVDNGTNYGSAFWLSVCQHPKNK